MLKLYVKSLNIRKEYNEEYTDEWLARIVREIRNEHKDIIGFLGYVEDEEKRSMNFNVVFLKRLAHITPFQFMRSCSFFHYVHIFTKVKVRVVNDESGEESVKKILDFTQQDFSSDLDWYEKNKIEFIVENERQESLIFTYYKQH